MCVCACACCVHVLYVCPCTCMHEDMYDVTVYAHILKGILPNIPTWEELYFELHPRTEKRRLSSWWLTLCTTCTCNCLLACFSTRQGLQPNVSTSPHKKLCFQLSGAKHSPEGNWQCTCVSMHVQLSASTCLQKLFNLMYLTTCDELCFQLSGAKRSLQGIWYCTCVYMHVKLHALVC